MSGPLQNSESPNLAELLKTFVGQSMENLHVCLPGRIESYDEQEQKADIKPLLQRPLANADGDILKSECIPIIHDVPIQFPRGGGGGTAGFFISWPLAKGDFVTLHFTDYSLDQWISKTGEDTDPIDFRTHDLSDAFAVPGLYPFKRALSSAHADNMVIGKDDGIQIHIKPAGEIALGSENPTDFVALASLVLSELTAIKIAFDLHTHSGVVTGGGVSGPPSVPLPAPSSVASTKVSAD